MCGQRTHTCTSTHTHTCAVCPCAVSVGWCSCAHSLYHYHYLQVIHINICTQLYSHTHTCTHLEWHNIQPTQSCALYKQENKKCNEFLTFVQQGPHVNNRLLKHNFRGEEKDKVNAEKPLVWKSNTRLQGRGRSSCRGREERGGWNEEKVAERQIAKTSAW